MPPHHGGHGQSAGSALYPADARGPVGVGYFRLRGNGGIAFLEDFEEGQYVDLFEMREYKPSRVHAAAKKQKETDGTEELQTGRKYLFSIGRTDKLFGETPNDLINGCIRAEGGGPKAFNVF